VSENWVRPSRPTPRRRIWSATQVPGGPEIVPFVEVNGILAGVGLAIPNLNEAIYDLNGRLFPLAGSLLWRLKVRGPERAGWRSWESRKSSASPVRRAGLPGVRRVLPFGLSSLRLGVSLWTLEDNGLVNSLIRKVGRSTTRPTASMRRH
jgi:hypothetical protein